MEIELLDHVKNKFALCKIDGDKYNLKLKGYDASVAVSQGILVQKYRGKELGELCAELDRLMREVDGIPILETPTISDKVAHYVGADGKDLIDEWEETYPIHIFRILMWEQMHKYQYRLGKKDDIAKEVGKIADYARRWEMVEKKQ